VSSVTILDTSIFVDDLRTGIHEKRIESLSTPVRTCSVVLAELWRGATNASERKFLQRLERQHPILTPTEKNWLESGRILASIRANKGYTREKLRDLHFDVLIALTARSQGAKLVTSNRGDFELIKQYRSFDLELW